MESYRWLNTTKLVHAMLPRNKVISHSLEYLTVRLCSTQLGDDWNAHLGESDAMALMMVIKTLRDCIVAAGVNVVECDGRLRMTVNDTDSEISTKIK